MRTRRMVAKRMVFPRRVIFRWGESCGQGLGDVVRGIIVMHQFCQRIGVALEVDMIGNVLCEYLEYETPPETHAEFERCKGQMVDLRNLPSWPQTFSELARLALNKHTFVIFTNYIPFVKPSKESIEFVRNVITLKPIYRMQPPSEQYRLVHLRVGDFFMLEDGHPHKRNPDCRIAWDEGVQGTVVLKKFMQAHPNLELKPGDVVITDCQLIREAIREHFPAVRLSTGYDSPAPAHLGYERDPERIRATIDDMQLIIHAAKVVSFSAYPRPSNFVLWLCTCYGIPMDMHHNGHAPSLTN